jgi:ubiquinone/menaquinone biosynthesis C-methylase UbiE
MVSGREHTHSVVQPVGSTLDKEHSTGFTRALVDRFNTAVLDMVAVIPGSSVLDVACGDGWLTSLIAAQRADAACMGVDRENPDQRVRWRSRTEPNLSFDVADLYHLPFPDRYFDVVTMFEALEHCDDPQAALREILRVARRGVVVSVPWEPWWRIANVLRGKYLSDGGNTPGHVNHWGRRAFVRLVAEQAKVQAVKGCTLWTIVRAQRTDPA